MANHKYKVGQEFFPRFEESSQINFKILKLVGHNSYTVELDDKRIFDLPQFFIDEFYVSYE